MASGPVGLWVDWNSDGFGTGAYDDCTSLVTRASYSRGSSPEITGAAQAGQAVFTVRNPAGLFNPDNSGGPLYGLLRDGAPVWWGMREDGTISGSSVATVRGRFAGRVVEVVPLPQAGAGSSTPLAQIICEDPLALYGRTPVALSDDCSPPVPCPDATPAITVPPNLSGTSAGGGYLVYSKPGLIDPVVPTPGYLGAWNFPQYNIGGIDYAGDCVANSMQFMAVGDGRWVIPTLPGRLGETHPISAYWQYWNGVEWVTVQTQLGNGGDTFTFVVSTFGQTRCYNRISINDDRAGFPCGGTIWGYGGGATWTPAP